MAKLRKATADAAAAATPAETTNNDDDEIDIDDLDEDDENEEEEPAAGPIDGVSTKTVSTAVFGGLANLADANSSKQ